MSISKKLGQKLPGKRDVKKTDKEKLDERREEVLSKGKKFKYPIQYAKHRLVLVTIIVATLALIALTIAGWAMLYKVQDTGNVIYRLTKVIPVPVAKIDGENVRYSDYLMIYKSSITPVERQGAAGTLDDLDGMKDYYKRAALTSAEDFTIVEKYARDLGITVSEEEIDQAFDEHRTAGGSDRSRESFLRVLADNFDMSESEYRRMLKLGLLKTKVAKEMDAEATKIAAEVAKILRENDGSFDRVQEILGDKVVLEETGGMVSNLNVDGGRAKVATSLEKGKVSDQFISNNGDGYYFVKLVDKTDSEVNYKSVKVPFTVLDAKLAQLRKDGKVEEYISIPEIETSTFD